MANNSNEQKKYASISTLQTFLDNLKNLFATKTEVDNMELITVDDIDAICGNTIRVASLSEVAF